MRIRIVQSYNEITTLGIEGVRQQHISAQNWKVVIMLSSKLNHCMIGLS